MSKKNITKLSKILTEKPAPALKPHPYENFVTRTFHHEPSITPAQYIGAPHDPRILKYGLTRPQLSGERKIDFSKDAALGDKSLGENEMILISKAVEADHSIVAFVGAMGSGKSTFLHMLSKIFPHILIDEQSPFNKQRPIFRIINLATTELDGISHTKEELIRKICVKVLKDKLGAILHDEGVTLEYELTTVWEDFLKRSGASVTDDARDDVVERVRSAGLLEPAANTPEARLAFLAGRRSVRESIAAEPVRYLKYLIAVLSTIRRLHFPTFRAGVVIALDNLDPLSPVVLRVLRRLVATHMTRCDFRVLVTMRTSTYRTQVVNQWQLMVDHVPHTGPTPTQVVISRIENSEKDLAPNTSDHLHSLIEATKNMLRDTRNPAMNFLNTVCGWSIRRALVLAQYLFVSPFVLSTRAGTNDFSAHTFVRAFICGPHGRYEWHKSKELDNLFAIHAIKGVHLLTKLRLLQAISNIEENRWPEVSELLELGTAFGYSEQAIRFALDEMMCAPKRLIWTNTILEFPDAASFSAAQRSHVYLSRAGSGYLKAVQDLTYVQEMMLDAFVLADDWPNELAFERPVDRANAVIQFLRVLLHMDLAELQEFEKNAGWEHYEEYFGSKRILSTCVPACTRSIIAILEARSTSGHPPADSNEVERIRLDCKDLELLAGLRAKEAVERSSQISIGRRVL